MIDAASILNKAFHLRTLNHSLNGLILNSPITVIQMPFFLINCGGQTSAKVMELQWFSFNTKSTQILYQLQSLPLA